MSAPSLYCSSTATWLLPPAGFARPGSFAARLRFNLRKKTTLYINVTADERYHLFLDGKRIGCGPERGDRSNWFCARYELPLPAGQHVIVGQIWALGEQAPAAQMSAGCGFYLMAEGADANRWNTGVAPWEVKTLSGYSWANLGGRTDDFYSVGDDLEIDGGLFNWGFEAGEGEGWHAARAGVKPGLPMGLYGDPSPHHRLRPAYLPPMLDTPCPPGRVRFAEQLTSPLKRESQVRLSQHDEGIACHWQRLLEGEEKIAVGANKHLRIIIDLEDYYCAYSEIEVSGGEGSRMTLRWAEALYRDKDGTDKGDRADIADRYFFGLGDRFLSGGGEKRCFSTLWWRAGRYLQLEIATGKEALTIERLSLRETRYPLKKESLFNSDEPLLAGVHRIGLRGLQMCAHETYMDCPHYEQLMYAGDTRLEMLTHYVLAGDDRLQRKALELFDASRFSGPGLVQSRYPSSSPQVIPAFSLWWIASLHDHALWRGNASFIKARMPGVRAVLEHWLSFRTEEGLVRSPDGWNFCDWVSGWERGIPPGGDGISGVFNWHFVSILGQVADLESWCGEPELAARAQRLASSISRQTSAAFWDAERGLFADDLAHRHFSEHAQCLAILSNKITRAQRRALQKGLSTVGKLAPASIYFSFYLLEAFRSLGMEAAFHQKLTFWYPLEAQGFKTPPERLEPSRSDCHAWGAHPVFHSYASILGIRPLSPGFREIEIRPFLGPLHRVSGSLVHPLGMIHMGVHNQNGRMEASVELPEGVSGSLLWKRKRYRLEPGGQKLFL